MQNIKIKNIHKTSTKTLLKIHNYGLKDDFVSQCPLWYPSMLELKKRKAIK